MDKLKELEELLDSEHKWANDLAIQRVLTILRKTGWNRAADDVESYLGRRSE